MFIDERGNLILKMDENEVVFNAPEIYQEFDGKKNRVEGSYDYLNKQDIGFVIGPYDEEYPLIIDPVLVYSTYLGGSNHEQSTYSPIAVDSAGNAVVVGHTQSSDFPLINPINGNYIGFEAFITKFNPAGSPVFSTFFGGTNQDDVHAVALDLDGNIYITGQTWSEDFPVVNAFQNTLNNGLDAFVTKLTPDGSSIIYSTYLGGSGYFGDAATDIAVNKQGSAYIVGSTNAMDFPLVDAVQDTMKGVRDLYVAAFSPDGSTLIYSTYLGGSDNEAWPSADIAVDVNDNIYVSGSTKSDDFPTTPNSFQQHHAGNEDTFVAKIGVDTTDCIKGKIWEIIEIAGKFNINETLNKVTFFLGDSIITEAEIVQVTEDTICIRVPEQLLGPRAGVDRYECDNYQKFTIKIEVEITGGNVVIYEYCFKLICPHYLIYDQVGIGGPPVFSTPSPVQQTLPQFLLFSDKDAAAFVFIGKSTDGTAGLRVMNTRPFPTPLRLEAFIIGPQGLIQSDAPINVGLTNEGFQFPVNEDGLYIIIVRHKKDLPGVFPSPFQIHLSGNVGVPMKKVSGIAEYPRATRLDILFNHSAPRPQTLVGEIDNTAQTGLFKFANLTTYNPYVIAVLMPPTPTGFCRARAWSGNRFYSNPGSGGHK